jgi:hypothetical protein
MATPQQIYYQNNREAVLKYKKAFYAKKSKKQEIALLKNIQLKGKTKSQSNKIIKTAIYTSNLVINYRAPDIPTDPEEYFDFCAAHGKAPRTSFTPRDWIENKRSLIRIDQITIVVDYRENVLYSFSEEPQERKVLEITFEPWMLERVMSYQDD